MQRSTIIRTSAVGAVCALAGGAAGIAASSASSPHRSAAPRAPRAGAAIAADPRPLLGFGPLAHAAGPPVHSDAIVPNDKGGFDSVTTDRGSFSSLSGDQLTISEGTKTAAYKTVTLTIPSHATVRRNGEQAKLSGLKAGDSVLVLQSPQGTFVAARDGQHAAFLHLRFGRPGRDDALPAPAPPPELPGKGSSGGSRNDPADAAEAGAPS